MANFDRRKWWHTNLRILDRSFIEKSIITTIGNDPASNANSNIQARTVSDCSLVNIPTAAWIGSESPGYFIYRPTLSEIEDSVVSISSYSDVVDIQNRRIFEYQLQIAHDESDLICETLGPPNTIDDDLFSRERDSLKGLVLSFPTVPYIDRIGCCDITLSNPGEPILPGSIQECSRMWYIAKNTDGYHLWSYDISANPGLEKVDRGQIVATVGTTSFHDICWDNRNKLWALENKGIRQILPGSSSQNSIALDYASVTDNANGIAVDLMFPDTQTSEPDGTSGMSFNQNNNKLYVSINNIFFELIQDGPASLGWKINQYIDLGSSGNLHDLAFDPYGNCFCVFNNKIAKISIDQSNFGQVTYVNQSEDYSDITGLDFILTLGGESFVSLFGIGSSGNFYEINYSSGTKIISDSILSVGETAITGATSCQAGEDLRTPVFPFDTGSSPWLFILDASLSMNDQDRWNTLVSGMVAFIQNNITLGDKLKMILFNDGVTESPTYSFHSQIDVSSAVEWIQSQSPASGNQFCINEPFTSSYLSQYNNVYKNIIIISSGSFVDCNNISSFTSYVTDIVNSYRATAPSSEFGIFRTVGIHPENSVWLQIIGDIGSGGYSEWE